MRRGVESRHVCRIPVETRERALQSVNHPHQPLEMRTRSLGCAAALPLDILVHVHSFSVQPFELEMQKLEPVPQGDETNAQMRGPNT